MGLTYFKRYRMEFDLSRPLFDAPPLPPDYVLLPWHESLVRAHADVKYRSFRFEIDANVFPSLGTRDGCQRLVREITRRGNFVPEATWLLQHRAAGSRRSEPCGTIQGLQTDAGGIGAVQNLGVTPAHRGKGLGTLLLRAAMLGFREAGMRRTSLEVTVQNSGAVRLYERLGFVHVKTVYKAAEVAYA